MKAVFALALVSLVGLADAEITTDYNSEMLDLINDDRKQANAPEVCINYKVIKAAQGYANHMAAYNSDSKSSDGNSRLKNQGFKGKVVDELVGTGYDNAVNMLKVWEKQSMKTIVSTDYNLIGIGYAHNSSQSLKDFWVIYFAKGQNEKCDWSR